jgi:hypothetical protein
MMETSVVYRTLNISSTRFGAVETWVVHDLWMAAATVLFLAVSLLFLVIAAKRISPIPRHQAQKLEKRKV